MPNLLWGRVGIHAVEMPVEGIPQIMISGITNTWKNIFWQIDGAEKQIANNLLNKSVLHRHTRRVESIYKKYYAIPKWIPPILGVSYFEEWDELFKEVLSIIAENHEAIDS